jgi:pimeloyl-ACP methyl ester carboxylesterase
VPRPRLLLVPTLTELEWRIKPLLEQWADVASYDGPGIGNEPMADPLDADVLVARGLAEVDRRGWDRCVIAGDDMGNSIAVRIATARPEMVEGMALGHAALSFSTEGSDAPVNAEIMAAFNKLLDTDYRAWVRAYTQVTQGAYDDATMERFLERVPEEVCRRNQQLVEAIAAEADVGGALRQLNVPLLLAGHSDCLVFNSEGYQRAIAAFPEATTITTPEKPSCSPAFAEALRAFAASSVPA